MIFLMNPVTALSQREVTKKLKALKNEEKTTETAKFIEKLKTYEKLAKEEKIKILNKKEVSRTAEENKDNY